MSDIARPEVAAFRELEGLVRALTEEMASFRRRALSAESRLRELEESAGAARDGGAGPAALLDRIRSLEEENAALSARLSSASERARQVLGRLHFLRQQTQQGGET
jgi:predicted  nucleic acid-binding Zn-ribbon protein